MLKGTIVSDKFKFFVVLTKCVIFPLWSIMCAHIVLVLSTNRQTAHRLLTETRVFPQYLHREEKSAFVAILSYFDCTPIHIKQRENR